MTTLLVGLGGTLGVLSRYGISRLTLHTDALVWSTVGINIASSFLLGLLVAEHWFDRDLREAIGVGFLGASRPSRPSPSRSCWRSTPASPAEPPGTCWRP
jgi:fluoride ion exporter CrcB/FEX